MSRDPEDGKPIDPKTLHKYLYAGGDPVNGIDPLGREELLEAGLEIAIHSKEAIQFGAEIALCERRAFTSVANTLEDLVNGGEVSSSSENAGTDLGECVIDALKGLMSPGGIPIF